MALVRPDQQDEAGQHRGQRARHQQRVRRAPAAAAARRASATAPMVAAGAEQQRRHEADERLDLAVDVAPRASRAAAGRESRSPCRPPSPAATSADQPVELVLEQQRHHAQHHALQRHRADERRQPAAAQREQVSPIARPIRRFEVPAHAAPPFHATSSANRHSRNAVVSSSGTRRNANRASSDSTRPDADGDRPARRATSAPPPPPARARPAAARPASAARRTAGASSTRRAGSRP